MRVNFSFLKPKILNVLITVIILCLPLFREQYNQGQYVAWYKPMEVLFYSLRERGTFGLFLLMLGFSSITYFLISLVILKINQRITNWKK